MKIANLGYCPTEKYLSIFSYIFMKTYMYLVTIHQKHLCTIQLPNPPDLVARLVASLPFSLPICIKNSLKPTVQLPTPPDLVVTMLSPFPFPYQFVWRILWSHSTISYTTRFRGHNDISLPFSLPICMKNPLKPTVQLPTPPDLVVTMISPFPFPGPVRAIILLLDFHSADNIQSTPQIFKPGINIIIHK